MHGLVYRALEKYADARLGPGGWGRLLAGAQLQGRMYSMFENYGDDELTRLVEGAARTVGLAVPAVHEDFGRFIVPDLLRFYGLLIRPEWKTLDIIEHTEEVIHTVVRRTGGTPPRLVVRRASPSASRLEVEYASARRMCGLAMGIIQGLSEHFGERVEINQPKCLLRGDPACLITVSST